MYFEAFYSFRYGLDSGSLLKAIMGPVEVKILLSLGGRLSHGQSRHIYYFNIIWLIVVTFEYHHFYGFFGSSLPYGLDMCLSLKALGQLIDVCNNLHVFENSLIDNQTTSPFPIHSYYSKCFI